MACREARGERAWLDVQHVACELFHQHRRATAPGLLQHQHEVRDRERRHPLAVEAREGSQPALGAGAAPGLPNTSRHRHCQSSALQTARQGRFPSNEELVELQSLAAQSIGATHVARLRGLTFEQHQLIVELELLQQHVEALDGEIAHIIAHSREGQIVTSIPGIGSNPGRNDSGDNRQHRQLRPPGAAQSLLRLGAHAHPVGENAGPCVPDAVRVRSLKRTLYLAVWQTLRTPDNEFARLYARLVPRKCAYDERTWQYRGKGKVIGRVAGQLITVLFTLLKRDQERVAHAKGGMAPAPDLYDPELHRRHRAGQYQPPARSKPGTVEQLPPH